MPTIWDERKINPGDERKQVYYSQLDDANIILLFISADFIRSDDCHNDLQQALKSYEQNQTLLIPILRLRPAFWKCLFL